MIHVLFYHQEVDFKINKRRQRCWQHQQLSSLPLHFLPHWVCVCVCVCVRVCPHLRDFPSVAHDSLLLGHPSAPTYPTQPPFPSQLGVKKKLLGHSIDQVPWSFWPTTSASVIIQRTSRSAHWPRLRISNTAGSSSIPGQGTRSHMPQLSPHTTTKKPACHQWRPSTAKINKIKKKN